MTREVLVHVTARRQVSEIQEWYADQSSGLDVAFARALEEAVEAIAGLPGLGRLSESGRRRIALKAFPYLLWYVAPADADVIILLAVTHQRRDPQNVRLLGGG